MGLTLQEKDAKDWTYRGEGAVNLVLSYVGSSPSFVGKVLRVQKALKNEQQSATDKPLLSKHECLLWKDVNELVACMSKETLGQHFVLHVMSPLLGSEHVDAGTKVLVSKEFLELIDKKVSSQRPSSRVDAAKVNTLCDSALLISDHSVFPHGSINEDLCVAVEIKPKCGFLPCSRFLAEKNSIKRSVSRFRMHQFLKLHNGEISRGSEYDPLDLFSGSKGRVMHAINSLIATPQNNFRVFVNSSLVFGAMGGFKDEVEAIDTCKMSKALEDVLLADPSQWLESFVELIAELIIQSKVLDQLLRVQKLDRIDIEGAIHAYYNIISEPCAVCNELGNEQIKHQFSYLHSLSLEDSLQIVREFLIATTAKDCSLMISFRPRKIGGQDSGYSSAYLQSTKQTFEYKAYFIDLDMKPLKRMAYYYDLDQRIVGYYKRKIIENEAIP